MFNRTWNIWIFCNPLWVLLQQILQKVADMNQLVVKSCFVFQMSFNSRLTHWTCFGRQHWFTGPQPSLSLSTLYPTAYRLQEGDWCPHHGEPENHRARGTRNGGEKGQRRQLFARRRTPPHTLPRNLFQIERAKETREKLSFISHFLCNFLLCPNDWQTPKQVSR